MMPEQNGDLAAGQATLLCEEIVRPNVETAYGRAHGFSAIKTVDDYRSALPLVGYEDLRPWIERMAAGEAGVLTAAKPIAFFKTSGSTSKPKLVPVTRAFAAQKARAFGDYWKEVYKSHPTLEEGRMIANFGDHTQPEKSAGGTRILSETSFWNERMQIARGRSKWPTPPGLRRIEDPEIRYFAAARYALQGPLHGIMCLNPSTLLSFCRTIERCRAALAEGLAGGRLGLPAAESDPALDGLLDGLEKAPVPPALAEGPLRLGDLWPELSLVICWRSEAVRPYTRLIEPYLEGVAVRDYLAQSSECIMAVPFEDGGSGGRLAVQSHFYEFIEDGDIERGQPETLLAGELEVGRIYELVASTAGGFCRYRTGDRLKVVGQRDGAPVLDFVGRAGVGSSMTGEKLSEAQVRSAVEAASQGAETAPTQVLCFPRSGTEPHYGLLLSGLAQASQATAARGWVEAFERELQIANCEYRDKRASGRLGPPRGFLADADAFELHRRQIAEERKVSLDQVKVGLLTSTFDLDQSLRATPVDDLSR
ncbi:MAG: GH3 auxin-responsive promoter family protein [Alphaproteobacteria bacterium]|nr:GH3 auxin-responsive promoter family protein [Alphaproteobacteria bacterium]